MWLTELLARASREDEEDGIFLARSNLEAKPILMHGVAPHMCDKSACHAVRPGSRGSLPRASFRARRKRSPSGTRAWYDAWARADRPDKLARSHPDREGRHPDLWQ